MENELISVIVPVFNIESFFERCINSIITQTYKNLEIILIDDGSIDKSGIFCDVYKEKDSRIRVIHQNNQGLSVARNVGLDVCKGEYISFIDGDDYVKDDFIEKLYTLIKQNDADIAICSSLFLKTNNIFINGHDYKDEITNYKKIHSIPVWERLYKKHIFSKTRFPKGKFCEDSFIFFDILTKAKKIVSTSDTLYIHSLENSNSITTKVNSKLCLDLCEGMKMMICFASKNGVVKENINRWFLWALNFFNVYFINFRNFSKQDDKKMRYLIKSIIKSSFFKLYSKNKMRAIRILFGKIN